MDAIHEQDFDAAKKEASPGYPEHEDRGIEPMVQAQAPIPPADLYPQDPSTDQDIINRQTETGNDYPPFVFVDYQLSNKNYWGKPNMDGKDHLVPRKETVMAVNQIHIDGANTIGKMIELARMPENAGNFRILSESWEEMMKVDMEYRFPLMSALGSIASRAFAERAFQKYMYMQAASKLKTGEEPPEWFGGMVDRMTRASAACGTWNWVHICAWKQMEWANAPTYNNVLNDIIMRLVNNAKYLEKTYGPAKREMPKVADHLMVAALL